MGDVERLEAHLTVWERPPSKCVDVLSNTGEKTIYRRRVADLRVYSLREDETLYCLGVGKETRTYDRDLDRILARATEHRSE